MKPVLTVAVACACAVACAACQTSTGSSPSSPSVEPPAITISPVEPTAEAPPETAEDESTDPLPKKLTNVSGRLAPSRIQAVVRGQFGRLRLCYENALRKDPTLQGKVTVRFAIGRDGKVMKASATGDIANPDVISCVGRAFEGMTFPKPDGGIVTVSYPVVFSQNGNSAATAPPAPSPTP